MLGFTFKEIIMLFTVGTLFGTGTYLIQDYFKSSPPPTRINSVFDATNGKFPALVRLEYNNGIFFCSGTVISDELVLTAAHCIEGAIEANAMGVETSLLVASLKDSKGETTKIKGTPIYADYKADYALIKGSFQEFNTMQIEVSPTSDLLYKKNLKLELCGFPYGSSSVCYPSLSEVKKYIRQFELKGQMYPGMSGGPVIDIATGKVVGVNSSMGEDKVFISPLIGLFQLLE